MNPLESLTGLHEASDSAQQLNVSSLVCNFAHLEKCDPLGAFCSTIVDSSSKFWLRDYEDIVFGQLLKALQIIAVDEVGSDDFLLFLQFRSGVVNNLGVAC